VGLYPSDRAYPLAAGGTRCRLRRWGNHGSTSNQDIPWTTI
jgi:hypothetical protein